MKDWRKCKIGDICRVLPGFAFKSSDWTTDGIPVLKIKSIVGDNTVDLKSADYVPTALRTKKLEKFILFDGDIVVAMTGATAGKVGRVRTNLPVFLNQRVAKIQPVGCDYSFIWSVLSSPDYQRRFFRLADGAAQPNMSSSQIEGVEINLPAPEVQKRIGGILSAYDDLIEVNQRRIAILEEMARRLFDEWFVRYRYPGHEAVPLVETELGLAPEGWRIEQARTAFKYLGGGTPSKAEIAFWENGTIDWYTPTDLTKAGRTFVDGSELRISEAGLAKGAARLFPAFSIMMTSRATLGVFAINTNSATTNQGFITFIPSESAPLYFLLHLLKQEFPRMEAVASGATFKEVTKGALAELKFLIPPKPIVRKFEALATPMMQQVLVQSRQNSRLRAARDLLLPKLISGEIDVSRAEATFAEAAE